MNRAIALADIRNALNAVAREAMAASDDDAEQRDAHLFRVLVDVDNIRGFLQSFDESVSEIREMASALAASGRPQ